MWKKNNYTIEYSNDSDSNNPDGTYPKGTEKSPALIGILVSPLFFGILIAVSILANVFLYIETEGRYILSSASLYEEIIGVAAFATFMLFICLILNGWAASKYTDIAVSILKRLKKSKYALLLSLGRFEKAGFSISKKRTSMFMILALIALCFYGYTL